jgi:hypothetical protein
MFAPAAARLGRRQADLLTLVRASARILMRAVGGGSAAACVAARIVNEFLYAPTCLSAGPGNQARRYG